MTEGIVPFDGSPLSIENIVDLAKRRKRPSLSRSPEFVQRINDGAQTVADVLARDGVIYGVTTGYGDSCEVGIDNALVDQLPVNLSRFHGCGLGDFFSAEETRAILAVRLNSLCQGYSGVSFQLLEYLAWLLNNDVLPLIPEEGSVGASGDLTPLSYIAGALIGERQVRVAGKVKSSDTVFAQFGIAPYVLKPKEALALMNGTAVMTALACINWFQADYATRLASRITSMAVSAGQGNPHHFEYDLFKVKPHCGQQQVAEWLWGDLQPSTASPRQTRVQDRYSLRCAPHIIGSVVDVLPFLKTTIENELNSANDNPIVDPDTGRILHGGHFYGGHIAMAMDTLKTQLANIADLHDRQIALLLDPKTNHGLPPNLTAATKTKQPLHHGFKAVLIGTSAWAAEALKQTMPASVFSRSTECHNQDKVSMGTIAARDCRRVLQLTQQVLAAGLLVTSHGVSLRAQCGVNCLAEDAAEMAQQLCSHHPLLQHDRALDDELRRLIEQIEQQHWKLYS